MICFLEKLLIIIDKPNVRDVPVIWNWLLSIINFVKYKYRRKFWSNFELWQDFMIWNWFPSNHLSVLISIRILFNKILLRHQNHKFKFDQKYQNLNLGLNSDFRDTLLKSRVWDIYEHVREIIVSDAEIARLFTTWFSKMFTRCQRTTGRWD